MNEQDPVLSILINDKIVDEESLKSILDKQQKTGRSLVSILKGENVLNEDQLARVVAVANKIEFINLSPEMVDPLAAHLVSYEIAGRHTLIPIKREENQLIVAMSSPLNLSIRDQIEMKTGYKVIPVAATPSAIRQAIHYYFDVASVTKQTIVSMRLKKESDKAADSAQTQDQPFEIADDPISKLVSSIIRGAIDAGASDIHIEPQQSDVRVRYRVDGLLRDAVSIPISAQLEVVSFIKIASDMDISERRVPQDGHIAWRHNGKEYDLRASSLPAVGGEKIVLRILDKNAERWSLDAVVTNPDANKKFRQLAANPYGMLLLTGPTGSGKTTTLYSVLQLLNTPQRNIVTVEDPVEYRLMGITQVQVKAIAGMTFASALRSILRQDPDIILIGEIRDLETAEIAVSAALTGHFVLSTLHTNDAPGAISRLVNLGIPPFLVGSALLGAVAQRLIRTSCPKCRKAHAPSAEEKRILLGKSSRAAASKLQRGTGCIACHETGYKGRKSIYEILSVTTEIRRMILNGGSDDAVRQQAIKEGMRTLRKGAVDEVLAGTTTLEEIMRVVDLTRD